MKEELNLLPQDGNLLYLPEFISDEEASRIFQTLKSEIEWRHEKIRIFGKDLLQPRLTAWYGENQKSYTYSGLTMFPRPWTPTLLRLKQKLEESTPYFFNSVLLNFYRSGADYVSWHADNEPELGKNPVIASLSFGEVRRFQLKHRKEKDLPTLTLDLNPGSLVLMSGETQHHWIHRIAPTKRETGERINLTFRMIN